MLSHYVYINKTISEVIHKVIYGKVISDNDTAVGNVTAMKAKIFLTGYTYTKMSTVSCFHITQL